MSVPTENFEPMQPSVVDGMVVPEIAMLGSTPTGGAWAIKVIHPNGPVVTSAAGIPDHTHTPVITPELRVNHIVSSVTGSQQNDDMDVLFLGGPDLCLLYRRYPAGTTPPTDNWQAVYWSSSGAINYTNVQFEPGKDSSLPPGSKVSANVKSGNVGLESSLARTMYAGLTIVHDAPALKDQGRVVAAQLPLYRKDTYGEFEIMSTDGNFPFVKGDHINLGLIPLTEDELFQATPGAYVNEAREGVYVPLMFNEPVHNFTSLQPGRDGSPLLTFQRIGDADSAVLTFRNASTKINYAMEGIMNTLCAVILFRGVDPASNFSLKARVGLEMQVERGESSVAPFQHQSPPLDRLAIDMVTRFFQSAPNAYPACYNDENGLLDHIREFLGLVKKGANIAGKVGLPFGGLIGEVLGGLGFSSGKAGVRRLVRAKNAKVLRALGM